jgi:hypothetical protein
MNTYNFRIGQQIKHFAAGKQVKGTVIHINRNSIITVHKTVKQNNKQYKHTEIEINSFGDCNPYIISK